VRNRALLKTRDLIHRESRIPFYKQIDLYSVDGGILIGVTGAMGKGFKLEGRDLLLESEAEINDFEIRMRKALNQLPAAASLHFIVRSQSGDQEILTEYADSVREKDAFTEKLVQSKISFYELNPLLKREVFLFVVIHPKRPAFRSTFFPDLSLAFGKKAKHLSELEYAKSKEALLEISREIKEGFQDLGLNLAPLLDHELLKYLYELLNPDYSEQTVPFHETLFSVRPGTLNRLSLRSRLLLTPPIVEDRFFYLSRFFHEGLSLAKLPEATSLKSMKDFEASLGKDYYLSVNIEVPDQGKLKARIKRDGNYKKARAFFSFSKDHEALAGAGETDDFLTEITGSEDRLFRVSFAVLARERERDALERRAQDILRNFKRLGDACGIRDHMNHDRIFLSFLPLQGDENPLSFTVTSEVLIHLLPIQSSWKGTPGLGILFKTYRDEPLRLDLFDPKLQAKHALMLGTTGSGKSFFTTQLLLHFLAGSQDHEVIVIDLGGSYRKLAQVLGGSYLEVECKEAFAFNPFPRKELLFPEGTDPDATFLQFLKELLQKMIAPERLWPASEKMILERAIWNVYGPLRKEESPFLGDLESSLRHFSAGDEEDTRKAYQFSKELSLFTEGEYGKILNRKGRFDFEAPFTVFDLRKISHYPELQELLLFIIPFALKRKFENLSIKKILVLDECWRLLKDAKGTELVEVFYRTARKMNAGVLSISQNPEDFLEAKIAGVIINNSPIKYILRLKKGYEKLASFGLHENEIRAIRELEARPGFYSEVFIKFDDRAVVAKLEPNPLDYWIATTDPLDLVEEDRLRRNSGNLNHFEILEKLGDQFPHGVKKGEETLHAR